VALVGETEQVDIPRDHYVPPTENTFFGVGFGDAEGSGTEEREGFGTGILGSSLSGHANGLGHLSGAGTGDGSSLYGEGSIHGLGNGEGFCNYFIRYG
jgi:hypothetical protein